ncbi:hypothetical protein DAPPUDRAFT_261967, partial [Daphnia pulex]
MSLIIGSSSNFWVFGYGGLCWARGFDHNICNRGLFAVILVDSGKEAQSAKQPFNHLKSLNPFAILKAEMAIRSIPSQGKACLDRFSMAANGTIRPTINNSTNGQRQCSFFINAPANKLIQMTCSVVNLKSLGAELAIYGGAEINVNPPAVNRIYTSRSDSMFLFYKVDNTDWFDCKWKMIPVPQTTEYQLCRDGTSATPNGTIQRSADDSSTDARMCMFAIAVPSDHRIQLKCSNVTLSSPDNYLQFRVEIHKFQTISESVIADPPAMNRVYTSTSEIIYLFSQFSNQDSFKCQWTTVMIPPLPTENKLCREKITKSASGNIQPLMANGTNVQPKTCSFIIEVPPNQLTEISCPVVNFTSPGSYLHFSEISDLNMALTPLANRVYTSGVDLIYLNSRIDVSKDWFNCTWKAVPAPSTTDFKLCRHGGTTSTSGSLQPFLDGLTTGEPRECYFFIELPLNEQIEFSCSSINLTSPGSYLRERPCVFAIQQRGLVRLPVEVNNLRCSSDDRRCNFNGKYNSDHDSINDLVNNRPHNNHRTVNYLNNETTNYVEHHNRANYHDFNNTLDHNSLNHPTANNYFDHNNTLNSNSLHHPTAKNINN